MAWRRRGGTSACIIVLCRKRSSNWRRGASAAVRAWGMGSVPVPVGNASPGFRVFVSEGFRAGQVAGLDQQLYLLLGLLQCLLALSCQTDALLEGLEGFLEPEVALFHGLDQALKFAQGLLEIETCGFFGHIAGSCCRGAMLPVVRGCAKGRFRPPAQYCRRT